MAEAKWGKGEGKEAGWRGHVSTLTPFGVGEAEQRNGGGGGGVRGGGNSLDGTSPSLNYIPSSPWGQFAGRGEGGGGRVVTRSTLTMCARVGRDKEEALYADLYISRVPIDTCRMHLKQHNFSQR